MNSSIEALKSITSTAVRSGKDRPNLYMPIYILTAAFGAIFIVGPFFIPKGPNKEVIKWCIMITAFSMWIFWVTVYIAQMNPLLGPRIPNTTLAWIIYSGETTISTPSENNIINDEDNVKRSYEHVEKFSKNAQNSIQRRGKGA